MAGGALQLGVRAQQWKVRFLGVIENPQRPAIRRMAALAFLAEPALVHIIVHMAVDAGGFRLRESQRRMALRAAHDPVQAQQRKCAQVMIEDELGPPGILAVTGFAAALELAAVRILAAVAAGAVLGKLLGIRRVRCGRCGNRSWRAPH